MIYKLAQQTWRPPHSDKPSIWDALTLKCLPCRWPVTVARRPRPATPAIARWRMPVATGPFCWPTLSTTRPGRGCSALAVARGPGRSPACPPTTPPRAGRRPLLGMRREVTHTVCAELGLNVWHDPHNTDRRFPRTRLRLEVLPLMEEVLGGGVAEALARTATALRGDTELIDSLIARAMPVAVTPN